MVHRNIIFVCAILLFSCRASGQKVQSKAYDHMLNGLLSHTVPELGVEEVDVSQPVIFLDARERKEYDVSHIAAAIWVGYDDFEMDRVGEIDKKARIIVYCSVGYRSEKISEKLLSAGFQDVSNLYGGIFEWVNQDLPVVNGAQPTQQVHAYDKVWGVWVNKGEKVYR
ncbi:MAG: rhodanese-like domain-containing protein [Bacteroidota bacterium]